MVGSAGLSLDGGLSGEVMPTPMPAIEPCLAVRDIGPVSTPSMLRTPAGGVAVRSFRVKVGLDGLDFFSPSRAAMTSRRSSSRAASKLMIGVCGDCARLGEPLPAMMIGGLDQEVRRGKGRYEEVTAAMSRLINKCPQDHP